MKKFIDAYKILEQNTADPFDLDKAFYEGAIPGLLRHLDPHSVFFDPGQFEQLKQMETSTRKGFGIGGFGSAGARSGAPDYAQHALREGRNVARR